MPVTTIMRDSQVGDDWIRQVCAQNPPQFVVDAAGNKTGNILTGPVRLAFTDHVFNKGRKMDTDPNSVEAWGVTVLFPPPSVCDMSIFWQEYCRIAQSEFPQNPWNPTTNSYNGLVPPWRDQGEKMQFGGYNAGSPFMNLWSGYKPAVVDTRMNPIVDESQIYGGVWAIVGVSIFAGGKGKPKRGPMFGLQSIMKIADDTNLGGAAPDPRALFSGVKGVVPPTGNAAQAFGNLPPNAPPAMGAAGVQQVYGGMPPAQPGPAVADDDISQFM